MQIAAGLFIQVFTNFFQNKSAQCHTVHLTGKMNFPYLGVVGSLVGQYRRKRFYQRFLKTFCHKIDSKPYFAYCLFSMYLASDSFHPTLPDAKISKKKLQAMRTREKILGAAMRSFAEAGYSGCSLDSIAQAADITKGAIYTHFATKLELFIAIIHYAYERVSEKAQEFESELPWPDPIIALLRECATNSEFPINHRLWVEILATASRITEVKEIFLCYHLKFREIIEKMLESGLSRKDGPPINDIESLSNFLFVMGSGLITQVPWNDSATISRDFKIFERSVRAACSKNSKITEP